MLVTILWEITTLREVGPVYNIDIFIGLLFGLGGGLHSQAVFLMSASEERPTMVTVYCWMVSTVGFTAIGVWFWFKGIKVLVSIESQKAVSLLSLGLTNHCPGTAAMRAGCLLL